MDCEKLMNLAERFLNEKGNEEVKVYLDAGELRLARVYLLGALDKLFEMDDVSIEELALAYTDLGLKIEEIVDIRNRLLQY